MKLLDDEQTLYAAAYGLYAQGDYSQAIALFSQLVLHNAFEENYWRGLAASHQMQKEYREALQSWTLVAILSINDPYPHFHAAECLLSLNEREEGAKALSCAERLLSKDSTELAAKITILKQVA